ncbi:Sporulation related domain-containing protein [Bradyrhizobium erythrophlei]|jgi:cytoskeletal protein RodZ|nr:Sporulation related domain-containing protein [Bradyrhizobium erythrophlei]
MADHYQDRPFPTDADHDRGANPYVRGESDPLAELAQLTGQTDPFGTPAKPPLPLQSRANVRPQYAPAEEEASAPAGPPPWRQRARQEAPPQQEYEEPVQPSPVHPLHRYAAPPAAASEQDHHEPQQDTDEQPADPSRYDDALYGPIKSVEQENARDPAYRDDPYAYQRDYEEEPEPRTRSGRIVTVAAVLALAVVGTGAAFAYRTYVGSPRSGEPPIITADNSPTKVVPAQSDGGASKIPDRMPPGDGGEKLVSREEAPVDVNSRSGASLVEFPPLNQNSSPPPAASVSPTGPALATAANGTMPNNEPRKIKALTVKGDAAENGGIPAGAAAPAKPDPAARSASAPTAPAQRNPSAANAGANAPLTLSSHSEPASDPAPPTRLAATNAVQTAPSAGGGYLVQVSSQKNEADTQATYRALQNKFPAALGSRPPVIKRADLGDKGVYYRTMVGPFGSTEEAAQFCGNLKSAGGQCVIQKN